MITTVKKQPAEKEKKAAFFLSSEWKNIKTEVYERDGGRCRCCGVTNKDPPFWLKLLGANKEEFEYHHLFDISNYWQFRNEKKYILTMCFRCHRGKKTNTGISGFHSWHGGTKKTCTPNDYKKWIRFLKSQGHDVTQIRIK